MVAALLNAAAGGGWHLNAIQECGHVSTAAVRVSQPVEETISVGRADHRLVSLVDAAVIEEVPLGAHQAGGRVVANANLAEVVLWSGNAYQHGK